MNLDILDQDLDFTGAKIALFCDGLILTSLRDDFPGLPYAGYWDLPGGGREKEESPFNCLLREVKEELNLTLSRDNIEWAQLYQGMLDPDRLSVFMVGHISRQDYDSIVLGDEGQGWKMMDLQDFVTDETIIPPLRQRVRDYVHHHRN